MVSRVSLKGSRDRLPVKNDDDFKSARIAATLKLVRALRTQHAEEKIVTYSMSVRFLWIKLTKP
jgi:hypothetical protein